MKKINNSQRSETRTIIFFGEEKFVDAYPIEIRSIDAWRNECGGWDHNNSFVVLRNEKFILPATITHRNILKFLRDFDILSEESKGKVFVKEDWPYMEIQMKGTFEPIIQIYFNEQNGYKMVL